MNYIIADTHFHHKKILEYEDRPFDTVEQMNEHIIRRWNQTVKKRDIIFHLGDVSFGNKEQTKKIMDRLNGRKRLIMGNHDRSHSVNWWYEVGFEEVYRYPIIINNLILSHEPVYLTKCMPYFNYHGHLHSKSYDSPQYKNLCVEHTEYKPVKMTGL